MARALQGDRDPVRCKAARAYCDTVRVEARRLLRAGFDSGATAFVIGTSARWVERRTRLGIR